MASKYKPKLALLCVLFFVVLGCGRKRYPDIALENLMPKSKKHSTLKKKRYPKTKIKDVDKKEEPTKAFVFQDLKYCFSNSNMGYILVDVVSTDTISRYNSAKYFTPASVTKLFTTYVILKYLGDSITRLSYKVTNDMLTIRSFADPTWYNPRFESDFRFFDSIKKANPKIRKYKIQMPTNYIEPYAVGWSWEDYNALFFKPKTMLSLGSNEVTIKIRNNRVKIKPNYLSRLLESNHDEGPNRNIEVGPIFRDFFSNRIFFSNQIFSEDTLIRRLRYKIPLYADDVDLTHILSEYSKKKFTLEYKDYAFEEVGWTRYSVFPSKAVLKEMLYTSNNFIAQQLLLQAKFKIMHTVYNIDSLYAFMKRDDWKDLPQPFYWIDASGLSRYNKNTPENLVFILQKLLEETGDIRFISDLLPTVGEGTLKNWNIPILKNNLFAKTGSMNGIFCLVGLLRTSKNIPLFFAFMINGSPIESLQCLKNSLLSWYYTY